MGTVDKNLRASTPTDAVEPAGEVVAGQKTTETQKDTPFFTRIRDKTRAVMHNALPSLVGPTPEQAKEEKAEFIKSWNIGNVVSGKEGENLYHFFIPCESIIGAAKEAGIKLEPTDIRRLIAHSDEKFGKRKTTTIEYLIEFSKEHFAYKLTPEEIIAFGNTFTSEGGNVRRLKEFLMLPNVAESGYQPSLEDLRIMADIYITRGDGGTPLNISEPIDEIAEIDAKLDPTRKYEILEEIDRLELKSEDYKNLALNILKLHDNWARASNICQKKGIKLTLKDFKATNSNEIIKIIKDIEGGRITQKDIDDNPDEYYYFCKYIMPIYAVNLDIYLKDIDAEFSLEDIADKLPEEHDDLSDQKTPEE